MEITFLNREPVLTEENFVRREYDIEWVRSKLERKTPQNCNLIGEPRIGKTSLLYYIYSQQIGVPASEDGLYVWIKLANLRKRNSLTFWQCMLEELRKAKESRSLGKRGQKELRKDRQEVFFDLDEEIKLLNSTRHTRIVFLIDNAELMFMDEGLDREDYDWLRSLAIYYNNCLAFVMSSTDPLHLLYKERFETAVSPFVNLFHSQNIVLLERDEAVELIQKASKTNNIESFNKRDIDFLLEEAGRHPDLLKIACTYLLEARQEADERMTDEEVYENVRTDVRYDGHVRWLCERLIERRQTDEEQKVLELLAEDKTDIDNSIVLRRLERHLGLVEKREGRLSLFADAFKYWVGKKRELDSKAVPASSYEEMADAKFEYLPDRSAVRVGDQENRLTALENRLMRHLWNNVDRVCTKDELLEDVWGASASDSVVEKAINRLRHKVETDSSRPTRIVSVRGQGYMLQNARTEG